MILYSTCKTSGLIVQSGEMSTEIVPLIEGYIISQGISNITISGYQLTNKFRNVYKDIYDINNASNHYWMAQKIKEKYAEIVSTSKDFEELMKLKTLPKKEYILPNVNNVDLGKEIYEIPESIFNPSIIGIQSGNLSQTTL